MSERGEDREMNIKKKKKDKQKSGKSEGATENNEFV